MQRYRCPRCGASAYSSADARNVGTCPACSAPLAGTKGEEPQPVEAKYRPLDMSAAPENAAR